jgi:hypothetical protein
VRNSVLVAVALLAALTMPGCDGGDDDAARERAGEHYRSYRTAEDERSHLEADLRRAISAIGAAAAERDRAGVIAAAKRGQRKAEGIRRLLLRELEAAAELQAFGPTADHGRQLAGGIRITRRGLAAVEAELALAHVDPFLDDPENEAEISRLARQVVILSRDGELAIRRADHAIALALGLEPRPDPLFD